MTAIAPHQRELIELLVKTAALRFGDFKTKSGRPTPYFINMGSFDHGASMQALGRIYATHMLSTLAKSFNVVFGPAYKAIPLAVAASQALYSHHQFDVGFAFNRKEAKDHGEGGSIVGCKLDAASKVVIVEDVITAGSTLKEIVPVLRDHFKSQVLAVVLAVDRAERGAGNKSALAEIEEQLRIKVLPIVDIHQIVQELSVDNSSGLQLDHKQQEAISVYLKTYGAT